MTPCGLRAWCAAAAVVGLLGCPRPPVDPVDGGTNADGGSIDWIRLIQDEPALGGDWYVYTPDNHTLASRDQVYVLKDLTAQPPRYAAFNMVSYYDEATAQSGRFTLGITPWNGTAWGAPTNWVASRYLSQDAPLCLDVFALAEVDCATGNWQLMMRTYQNLVAEGPLVVGEAGFFIPAVAGDETNQRALIATVTGTQDPTQAPDPTTIPTLVDGPADGWLPLPWELGHFAPHLPERGMVLGSRYAGAGYTALDTVYIMFNVRRRLIKFTVTPVTPGDANAGLTLRWAVSDFDFETRGPVGFGAIRTLTVPPPDMPGDRVWISLDQDSPVVTDATELARVTRYMPLRERLWDVSVMRTSDGRVLLATSPSSAVGNVAELTGRTGVTLENALQ